MPNSLPSASNPLPHGGDLAAAWRAYPEAPRPWVDLSTGINPWPYPVPALPPEAWARLPMPDEVLALEAAAALHYGVADPAAVVAVPGTQAALALLPTLIPASRVAVLGPTYAEHARAWALAGAGVETVTTREALLAADVAVVVNPNNPDGRILGRADLEALLGPGVLVVDEAFAEVAPAESLAGAAGRPGLVVLRSFGKFFGLAGLRLGFVLAEPGLATALRARLGPWAVSGPAIRIGMAALADPAWQASTRVRLAEARLELDAVLAAAGLRLVGGTDLFRLVAVPRAAALRDHLARHGLWTRAFAEQPDRLRLGLPPDPEALARLARALSPA